MGNSTSRVVGCFVPSGNNNHEKTGVNLDFLEPLDEGLGHSFCYVRPVIADSPAITPSNSERYTVDSSILDSETRSGSFRQDALECLPGKIHSHPETTFKTISGASVSANVSTARTGTVNPAVPFSGEPPPEPAASFESTASFAAVPLQPVPRGSGPLTNGFMSGPLERGFASGPLDKNMFMSGPLDGIGTGTGTGTVTDRSNFSAPLAYYGHKKPGLGKLVRSMSKPVNRIRRILFDPITRLNWNPSREMKCRSDVSVGGSLEPEYSETRNLQWAHGKAGEDRVHVVLSEEQGWLFVGIYDGFSGPDAPDFLMGNLYRNIDRELEGLLWEYEEKTGNDDNTLDNSGTDKQSENLGEKLAGNLKSETVVEIVEEREGEESMVLETMGCQPYKKSKRLYELLRMELLEESSNSISVPENIEDPNSTSCRETECTSSSNLGPAQAQDQIERKRYLFAAQLRKMYRKQKSLRKKLFPWSYDWHREDEQNPNPRKNQTDLDEKTSNLTNPGTIRRCRLGPADHGAVLKAMSNALQITEESYMELVESSLDKNPELALMGSCVLVMLMKDQDVYVMNLGDSRVILAQDRASENSDARNRNRSRESIIRMELDRISEESPVHNSNTGNNKNGNENSGRVCGNKNKELSVCRVKLRAVQMSSDHSTSIEEEVVRIKAEHPDDPQAVFNDRVKGQLKVTRAFGAAFLKKPKFNEALLEMFRIDYIGTAPYLSCVPAVLHHRLSSSDRFLVLSSDGLYQYFSNEEVVAHVSWFMENVPEGDPAQYLIAELLCRAAKKNGMDFHELLDIPHGDRRKYHDDVSVMVISLEGRIWRSSG